MNTSASLRTRLLVGAAIFIVLALIGATIVIGFILHRFVQGQIDQRLDTQLVFLSSMVSVGSDGQLSLAGNPDGPPFERPGHGWYWQVNGPRNVLRSRSLEDVTLAVPAIHRPPKKAHDKKHDDARPAPADTPDGLHYRVLEKTIDGVPVVLTATAPRQAVLGPLREALVTLSLSLAALGAALVLATMLQIRIGLRPLERLRLSVADIREGRRARLPTPQPPDIQPLALELNDLLHQNEANLERARRHVANLAHGLKTPLATLAIALSDRDRDPDQSLKSLVGTMERQIRHHLGRARAGALAGPARVRTVIAGHLKEIVDVLRKINAERPVAVTLDVGSDLAVACEPQDFDEMTGNLLENAFRFARRKIEVTARRGEGRTISIDIADDGPGLREDQVPTVLRAGARLDESAPGFGFGLSITRELAELYGGDLSCGASSLGGLRISLRLPAAG